MREQPPQQAPPVQRLRIQYAKRGRLRFTSHRDFSRAFERALLRCGVPMAYSSGFHPHPRISYANAAPTGAASEAEYLEIGLATEIAPDEVRRLLDAALPPGLDIVAVAEAGNGALADRLEVSRWRLTLADLTAAEVDPATAQFLAATSVDVERMTKRGLRTFDCRSAVISLGVLDDTPSEGSCAILDVVLRHGTPSVRPDDILVGLRKVSELSLESTVLMERLAQGPWDAQHDTVGDPLGSDRDAE